MELVSLYTQNPNSTDLKKYCYVKDRKINRSFVFCHNLECIMYVRLEILPRDVFHNQGPLLLTWFNFNPGMNK